MAGLNDDYFLADDSTELKPPTVTVHAFKDSRADGEEPELRDDIDLIAVPATEDLFIRLRDLELLRDSIRDNGGMSATIAMEAQAIMPDFINEERPIQFFTKMPSRTMLSAALEDIGKDQKGTVARLVEMITEFIKKLVARITAYFENKQSEDLEDFSKASQSFTGKNISWVKVAKAAEVEVPEDKKPAEAAPAEGEEKSAEGSQGAWLDDTLKGMMESDDVRKKAIKKLGDKLFVKLGEDRLKKMVFVGGPKNEAAEAFVDFVLNNASRARNKTDVADLQKLAAEAVEVVNTYRKEEASLDIGNGNEVARDIMSDVLYETQLGYFKEHFKFKGCASVFKSSFLALLRHLSEAIRSEEDEAKLKTYQSIVASINNLFNVHQEVDGANNTFLKLRKQYLGGDTNSAPNV